MHSFQNPVYPAYFADPFCFAHDGLFYAVGTGKDEADACPVTGNVIPMIKSHDLRIWSPVGHVLAQPDEEKNGFYWAPEIAFDPDSKRFHLYYQSNGARGMRFHIRCATADTPEGPYHDTGHPLTDLANTPFAIDAHPFRDHDGQWYLFYAADFLDITPGYFRGTALVVDRMRSMTRLEGRPRIVMRARHPWQLFQRLRDIYGKIADWYTLEGPTVRFHQGTYWLFYSGGCFENDTYGVDVLTAPHPLGPWREPSPERSQKGPQLIRTLPGKDGVIGPGHNSILTLKPGHDVILYHAWNPEMTQRQLWIDPLEWTKEGPRVPRFANYIAHQNTRP